MTGSQDSTPCTSAPSQDFKTHPKSPTVDVLTANTFEL